MSAYRSFFIGAREGKFELRHAGDLWRLLVEVTLHKLYRSAEHHSAQQGVRNLGLSQTTTEKLAKLILNWTESGEETPKGIRLKVLLTHEEIGQMIGSTRETVTRLLSDFRRRKYIDIKGSTVFVTNAGALEAAVTI